MIVIFIIGVVGAALINPSVADRFSATLLDRLGLDLERLPVSIRMIGGFLVVLAALIILPWMMVEIVPEFAEG